MDHFNEKTLNQKLVISRENQSFFLPEQALKINEEIYGGIIPKPIHPCLRAILRFDHNGITNDCEIIPASPSKDEFFFVGEDWAIVSFSFSRLHHQQWENQHYIFQKHDINNKISHLSRNKWKWHHTRHENGIVPFWSKDPRIAERTSKRAVQPRRLAGWKLDTITFNNNYSFPCSSSDRNRTLDKMLQKTRNEIILDGRMGTKSRRDKLRNFFHYIRSAFTYLAHLLSK